jgi:type IX secretion system PorP/SprF family membrane protein
LIKKEYILLLLISIFWLNSFSQDIHFSQYDASPLNLNPALIGIFNGDYRLIANHRNQWQSVTIPYTTLSASFDTKLNLSENYLGYGLLINADKSGDSELGTTQIYIPFSFQKSISKDNSLILSVGFNVGYCQQNINYSNLTFDSQYNGNQYAPDLPNNEIFPNNQLGYFDLSTGINLFHLVDDKISYNSGISFSHLTSPEQSFFDNNNILIDKKLCAHGIFNYRVKQNMALIPSFLYLRQGKFREFDLGGSVKYYLDNVAFHSFYFGCWLRRKDAGIVKCAFDYRNFNVGMSYDINTSKLVNASRGYGGFEISIIYIFNKNKPVIPVYSPCPIFI